MSHISRTSILHEVCTTESLCTPIYSFHPVPGGVGCIAVVFIGCDKYDQEWMKEYKGPVERTREEAAEAAASIALTQLKHLMNLEIADYNYGGYLGLQYHQELLENDIALIFDDTKTQSTAAIALHAGWTKTLNNVKKLVDDCSDGSILQTPDEEDNRPPLGGPEQQHSAIVLNRVANRARKIYEDGVRNQRIADLYPKKQ